MENGKSKLRMENGKWRMENREKLENGMENENTGACTTGPPYILPYLLEY